LIFTATWLVCLFVLPFARAETRAGVKIHLSRDTARPVVSGQPYSGVIEIQVGREGTLSDIQLEGPMWEILSVDVPPQSELSPGDIVLVPFQAIPGDATNPLTVSVRLDGRRESREWRLSAQDFEARRKRRALVRLDENDASRVSSMSAAEATGPPAPVLPTQGIECGNGGNLSYHFRGRLAYRRPDGEIVGVDGIAFRIYDEDDPITGDEIMCEGFTNQGGYFNVYFNWDDCSFIPPVCDDPDVYVEFETDTPVVAVQDSGILETDYSWTTKESHGVLDDYLAGDYDFGTLIPADTSLHPAFHIFNSIVRAHRFIRTHYNLGLFVERVEVQWPEPAGAWYDTFWEEIHIGSDVEWDESVHIHNYGHHFLENYSQHPSLDYCNGVCDGAECSSCLWCEESYNIAWVDGWSSWFAEAVLQSMPADYNGYTPMATPDFESTEGCPSGADRADRTEGRVAAYLHDISDDAQDDHGIGVDCVMDSLALGIDEIFDVVMLDQPTTVAEFNTAFRGRFPQYTNELWRTGYNVGNLLVWLDQNPPGPVTVLHSPSHPLGNQGTWPVITVEWDPPIDDASGAGPYSIEWGTAPIEPDQTAEVDQNRAESPPFGLGQYYVSIRARDCDTYYGDWSAEWASFGPFTIGECNNNGILDVCETDCNAFDGLCNIAGCGTQPDCNGNGAPDACDLADGTSRDCNANDIPDECEAANFIEWGCCTGGDWYDYVQGVGPLHWPGPSFPDANDQVCIDIPDDYGRPVVTHNSGTTEVAGIGCYEYFELQGGTLAPIGDAVFFNDLALSGGIYAGTGDLDVHGTIWWSTTRIGGSGALNAWGNLNLSEDEYGLTARYLEGDRVINATTTSWIAGNVGMRDNSVFNNRGVFVAAVPDDPLRDIDSALNWSGGNPQFVNHAGARFVKPAGTGRTDINVALHNDGRVEVNGGTLRVTNVNLAGPSSDGEYVAVPGASLEFLNGHDFLPNSSITAERVSFGGGYTHDVRGIYDVTDTTAVGSTTLNLHPGADLRNLGAMLEVTRPNPYIAGVVDLSTGTPVGLTDVQLYGTLQGSDDLTIAGTLEWTGGELAGAGSVDCDGTILFAGGQMAVRDDRQLNFNNIAVWSGGDIQINNNASLSNLGDFNIEHAGGRAWSNGAARPFLNETGATMTKGAGTGLTELDVFVDNRGTINVADGTLQFGRGSTNEGVIIGSPGAWIEFEYGTHELTPASSVNAENVRAAGNGVVNVSGSFTASTGTHVASATMNLNSTSVDLGSLLEVASPNPFVFGKVTLETGSTVSAGALELAGVISGADDLVIAGPCTWTAGRMEGPASPPGGVPAVTEVHGPAELRGILTLDRRELELVDSSVLWSGVILTLTGTATAPGRVNNTGTFYALDDTEIRIGTGSQAFLNPGTFIKKGAAPASVGSDACQVGSFFDNSGSLRVESGTVTLRGGGVSHGLIATDAGATLWFNGGTYDVFGTFAASGTTRLSNAIVTVHPGAIVSGLGDTLQIEQPNPGLKTLLDLSHGTATTVPNLELSGVSAGVTCEFRAAADVTVTQTFDWMGGVLTGSGTTHSSGDLFIRGANPKAIGPDHVLRNTGLATLSNGGNLILDAHASFENAGQFDILADIDIQSVGAGTRITNTNTFAKSGGTGLAEVGPAFENRWIVEVDRGTLAFLGGFTQTDGGIILDGGDVQTNTPLDLSRGMLVGNGSVIGSVDSGGQVRPGRSVGALTITGDYTQHADGALIVELGGSAACGAHDVLQVSGAASLSGTLEIEVIEDCQPAVGWSFPVLSYGSHTGAFDTIEGRCAASDLLFELNYGPTDLTLRVVQAPPADGDIDFTGRVDLKDFAAMQQCFTGPGWRAATCCDRADFDANGLIDLSDYAAFHAVLQGP